MNKIIPSNALLTLIAGCLIVLAGPTLAVSHFDETIPGPAAAVFHQLETFQTPTGTVGAELTVVRMVVTSPGTDLLIRVQPDPISGRPPADVSLGGLPQSITEDSGAIQVATVVAQTPTSPPTVAGGFEMVEIIVAYQPGYEFTSAETWSLQALQIATSRRYAGWVGDPCVPVSATNCQDEVTLPKLAVSPSTVPFGDVQINLPTDVTPLQPYTVENVGTDELTMTGPFVPVSGPFTLIGSFPSSLDPMENTEIDVQFRPTALGGGANQGSANIASDGPDSPTEVNFSGSGITMNAAFLMDNSGSMSYEPDGTSDADEEDSRLGKAKQGGFQLFEIYRQLTGGQANFGLYTYPDSTSQDRFNVATARTVVNMTSANAALGPVGVALASGPPDGNGLVASGYTPMAEGIKEAEGDLDTGANQRPLILLLADGDHNLDSTSGPATPEGWVQSLVSDGIRMFTIAYGVDGAAEVDFARLADLAEDTGGEPLPANAVEFGVLNKAFRSAVKDWLGLGEIDPNGTISANQSKTHNVCIDRTDYTATFVVDWEIFQESAIDFTLISPTNEVITPSTPGIAYSANDTYALYVIKGDRIRGGAGAGNWQIKLSGANDLPANMPYSYSVLTGTPYKPQPKIRPDLFYTGYDYPLLVDMSHLPRSRYEGLQLKAEYNVPANSFRSHIANTTVEWKAVSAELYRRDRPPQADPNDGSNAVVRARSTQPRERAATIYDAKARVIQASDNKFEHKRQSGEMLLYDDGTHGDLIAGDGQFTNNSLTFANDGLHEFHIFIDDLKATPTACLNRDFALNHYIDVGLSAELLVGSMTLQEIEDRQFFDPRALEYLDAPIADGSQRRALMMTPEDEFGNRWGPGRADQVKISLDEARAASPVFDQGDGTYLQLIDYERGTEPRAWVNIGNVSTQAVSVTKLGETGPTEPGKPKDNQFLLWILVLIIIVLLLLPFFRKRPG